MKKLWTFLKILFLRLRFLWVFLAIGFVFAIWDHVMAVVNRMTRPEKQAVEGGEGVEWYCPMHPSVVRSDPSQKCPICGMPLSKRKKGEKVELPPGVASRVQLSPFRVRQAGIATSEVVYRTLAREIRSVGFIDYDERRLAHISARIAGRADELFITFVGTPVKAGDPVYKLYSPELVTTQKEYLLALAAVDALLPQGDPDAPALVQAQATLASTGERLLLWGITQVELDRLEETKEVQTHLIIRSPIEGIVIEKEIHAGHYVEVGEDPYTVADLTNIWMQAEIFESDIALVRPGQTVEVRTEAYPGELFKGTVAFVEPILRAETRTVRVRADVPNPELKLKPGMFVTAILRIPVGRSGEIYFDCCGERSDQPGHCSKCEKERVQEGGIEEGAPLEYVYECVMGGTKDGGVRDTPGPCPVCGMTLGEKFKVPKKATPVGPIVETWVCPLHPVQTSGGKLECPECGSEMKHTELEQVLAVPAPAVVDTGTRKVAYVDRGDGTFEGVEVVIGPRSGDYYPVLQGLAAGDRVVTAGAFLVDAEAHLNPAAAAAFFGASGQDANK